MLPILITFLVIMVGITAVYFVGSQAPKKSTKPGKIRQGWLDEVVGITLQTDQGTLSVP